MRGRLDADEGVAVLGGSIPAGAGETAGRKKTAPRGPVDPRGCGGDVGQGQEDVVEAGRSPRVRGRRDLRRAVSRDGGSIPAGAGETGAVRPGPARKGVDPRGCGGDP